METILKVLQEALPFLGGYPPWVRGCVVAWILGSAGMIAILVLAPRLPSAHETHNTTDQVQSGQGNLQAGRDITVINQADRKIDALLEVTNVDFTRDAEFDVMVRNLGDTDLIIHKISIKKVKNPNVFILPILHPTAKYHIPVDDIPVEGTKSLQISQVVRARSADRFLIALETTHVYVLEVTLYYNKDQSVSFTRQIWME